MKPSRLQAEEAIQRIASDDDRTREQNLGDCVRILAHIDEPVDVERLLRGTVAPLILDDVFAALRASDAAPCPHCGVDLYMVRSPDWGILLNFTEDGTLHSTVDLMEVWGSIVRHRAAHAGRVANDALAAVLDDMKKTKRA